MAGDTQDPQGIVATVSDLQYGNLAGGKVAYQRGFANLTNSGDTELVAAVSGSKILLVWAKVINQGASVIALHFRSNDTAISANDDLAADGGGWYCAPPGGICETVAGEALDANLSGAGTVGITYGYVLVP